MSSKNIAPVAKKVYEKPNIKLVELIPGEAVLVICKDLQGPGNCDPASPCTLSDATS